MSASGPLSSTDSASRFELEGCAGSSPAGTANSFGEGVSGRPVKVAAAKLGLLHIPDPIERNHGAAVEG